MNIIISLAVIIASVLIGAAASNKFSIKTLANNRAREWTENERSDPLSQAAVHWTVVHIRDDIGSIHNVLIITNGLLAGVLATLALRLFL